jgi:hypothetical protein
LRALKLVGGPNLLIEENRPLLLQRGNPREIETWAGGNNCDRNRLSYCEGLSPMLLKAFRLFVSSTFADFSAERELLQSKVFPALDAYCAAKSHQFYPIDLRWGVNEEAQLDQRTAEICLEEVRAAKGYPPPNFLIMIGGRYGWVPLPYAIARDEFKAIIAWLEDRDRHDSARALGSLYHLDDNHLVARDLSEAGMDDNPLTSAYTLRSRVDDMPELKSVEAWANLEAQLRRALQEAADGLLTLGRINTAAHEKYFLSLTEQEIIHGLPGYPHGFDTASPPSTDGPAAIAFIRQIVSGSGASHVEREARLDALKDGIRSALPEDSIVTARVACDESGRLDETYLANFAGQVQAKLETAIDKQVARVEAIERSPDFALESERRTHRAFDDERLKIFVGRESNLTSIARYLAGVSDRPLVLHGRSGLGKSALMARAIAAVEAASGTPVTARFIGASPASSNTRSLLVSLIDDLAAHGIVSKLAEYEQDTNKFNAQIKALLSSIDKPAIVFLDALDQLQKPRDLGWLPHKLPQALKLVLSVLDDQAYETDSAIYRSLRGRLASEVFLEIEPLTSAQGREILFALEQRTRHRLQEGQRDYIIEKFENGGASPLYLRIAFEIARGWRSTVRVGAGRHVLAQDIAAVIAQLSEELSGVHHHEPELVTRTLGYLAAAKDGLSTKELTEVLSRDVDVMRAISSEEHGAHTEKLPPSVWVRLNRDLASFLIEKLIDDQPLLQFFHRQVAQVAHEQHYEPVKTLLHAALAGYFQSQATEQQGRVHYAKRSLSELPYQLHFAGETRELDRILESPDWIQQKFAAFGAQVLVRDYEQFGRGQLQDNIGRTLRLITGICERDKRQIIPQLHGRLLALSAADKFCASAKKLAVPPAIFTCRASLAPPGSELARLEGHDHKVSALVVLPDGRLASGGFDNTIRLWDLNSGVEIARLEGHSDAIWALAVLPDGRLASASGDRTIRLWDVNSGVETARLEGHSDAIRALAVLPDGRLASGSADRTIRLWDPKTGAQTARLEGDVVYALAALQDGSYGRRNQ